MAIHKSENEMSEIYLAALREAEAELAGLDGRRADLEVTIAGLRRLLRQVDQRSLPLTSKPRDNGGRSLPIPSGFFAGMSPTKAYRHLMRTWPGEYTAPQIADAFAAGGMDRPRTALLQAVHSVLKRDRDRKEAAAREDVRGEIDD